jgi:hypothetical protein
MVSPFLCSSYSQRMRRLSPAALSAWSRSDPDSLLFAGQHAGDCHASGHLLEADECHLLHPQVDLLTARVCVGVVCALYCILSPVGCQLLVERVVWFVIQ